MPVQKGKKRRRPRNRGARVYDDENVEGARPVQRPPAQAPPPWLGIFGRTPPPWVNATIGVAMMLLGIVFYVSRFGGGSGSLQLILLIGYEGFGAFYLSRAYRQYRARQEDE